MLYTTDLNNWEQLYDKYSPVLFAVIMRSAGNKNDAENILIEVFAELAQKPEILSHKSPGLMLVLIRHTQKITLEYLQHKNKPVIKYTAIATHAPVLNACLFGQQQIPVIAEQTGIAETEVRKNLLQEIYQLRHHPVTINTLL